MGSEHRGNRVGSEHRGNRVGSEHRGTRGVRRSWWPVLGLGVVLVGALLLRAWGIDFGLPYVYHPDEPTNVGIVREMIRAGDPNPRFFHYPSLFLYLQALLYVLYLGVGQLAGAVGSAATLPGIDMVSQGNGPRRRSSWVAG